MCVRMCACVRVCVIAAIANCITHHTFYPLSKCKPTAVKQPEPKEQKKTRSPSRNPLLLFSFCKKKKRESKLLGQKVFATEHQGDFEPHTRLLAAPENKKKNREKNHTPPRLFFCFPRQDPGLPFNPDVFGDTSVSLSHAA